MTGPKVYRSKPSEIEALQWTGDNRAEISKWCGIRPDGMPVFCVTRGNADLWSEASQAWNSLEVGHWVARDVLGFYPIHSEVFARRWTDDDQTSVSFALKTVDGDEATVTVDGFKQAATAARALIHCGSPDVVLKLLTQYAEQGDMSVVSLAAELGELAEKGVGRR